MMEDAPDIAGNDYEARKAAAVAADDGMAELTTEEVAQIVAESPDAGLPYTTLADESEFSAAEQMESDMTIEEKLSIAMQVIEYHDEKIIELEQGLVSVANVLVRLTKAVDEAAGGSPVLGPNGEKLNRKQRRDIEFGRAGE